MNNAIFVEPMQNVRKYRDLKLEATKEKKLFSIRTNFPTTKFFTENLLAIEMKKTEILMNKSAYLGLSIIEF